MKKSICAFFLSITIALSMVVPAMASTPTIPSENTEGVVPVATAAVDLSKHEKQEVTIQLSNGETAVLGAEPVDSSECIPYGEYPGAYGVWRIYWNLAIINVEYYINISGGRIISAYDQKHFTIGVTVTNCGLSRTPAKATGWWDYQTMDNLMSARGYLYAEMKGSTLYTSAAF